MTHFQVVFLSHYIPAAAIFWLWCNHYANQKKKARRQGNVYRAKG